MTCWEQNKNGGAGDGRACRLPILAAVAVVVTPPQGYVTFGGPAGAQGEGSSAGPPHRGRLNFHMAKQGARWVVDRDTERERERETESERVTDQGRKRQSEREGQRDRR